jgi:hypothetical protein
VGRGGPEEKGWKGKGGGGGGGGGGEPVAPGQNVAAPAPRRRQPVAASDNVAPRRPPAAGRRPPAPGVCARLLMSGGVERSGGLWLEWMDECPLRSAVASSRAKILSKLLVCCIPARVLVPLCCTRTPGTCWTAGLLTVARFNLQCVFE